MEPEHREKNKRVRSLEPRVNPAAAKVRGLPTSKAYLGLLPPEGTTYSQTPRETSSPTYSFVLNKAEKDQTLHELETKAGTPREQEDSRLNTLRRQSSQQLLN